MTASTNTPTESPQDASTSHVQREQPTAEQDHEGLDAWLQALGAFLVYTATW